MTDAFSNSIRHSRDRLERARDALDRLSSASDLKLAEQAWSDLLVAAAGIYAKIEQGSKLAPRSNAWFGLKKRERKQDPLLQYLHQARNSDEHSIADITQRIQAGTATISIREPFDPKKFEGVSLHIGSDIWGNPVVRSSNEEVIATKMYDRPSLSLLPVTNQLVTYEVPWIHLGNPLESQDPIYIAETYIKYLERFIAEAEQQGI